MKPKSTHAGRQYHLITGSLPWHLSNLELGECYLVNDKTGYAQDMIYVAIRSVQQYFPDARYKVIVCYGLTADMHNPPFRFYKVERTL